MSIIEDNMVSKEDKANGVRYRFEFPNGYLVSVMRNALTLGGLQGLWEVHYLAPNEEVVTEEIGRASCRERV
jgi:hypothetical protein